MGSGRLYCYCVGPSDSHRTQVGKNRISLLAQHVVISPFPIKLGIHVGFDGGERGGPYSFLEASWPFREISPWVWWLALQVDDRPCLVSVEEQSLSLVIFGRFFLMLLPTLWVSFNLNSAHQTVWPQTSYSDMIYSGHFVDLPTRTILARKLPIS